MSMSPRLLRPRQASQYASLRTSLLAYWPMNESAPSGDVSAVDWTRRGNDLVSNNSVLSVAGKVSNARQFVRANSEYLSVTSNDLTFGEPAWSIAFWFFVPTAASNSRFNLIGKDVAGSRHLVIAYNFDSAGSSTVDSIAFQMYRSDSTSSIISKSSATRNAWHFATLIHQASSATIDVEFDRVSVGSLTRSGAQSWASMVSQFCVGRREYSGFNDYADANIDELAIWGRALSSTELATLYNSGAGIDLRA